MSQEDMAVELRGKWGGYELWFTRAMCDIELVNDHWLVAKRMEEIKKGWPWSSFLFIPIFCTKKEEVINEKSPSNRWSLLLEPIKIIIRSSSPERLLSQTAQGEEGITRTSCVFLNRPVCVCLCATVLASVQLGGFGGQRERREGPSSRCQEMGGGQQVWQVHWHCK